MSDDTLYHETHRPRFHFTHKEMWMNDPNGLCFWQGRWHLFYQGYPPEDPRQHWGHAVSDDLIHWQDLPYAIYPHPEFQCFSGSTLVEEERVIAIYHGTRVGNMVAIASDPLLLNWEKLFIVRGKVEEAFGVHTVTIEKLFSLKKVIKKLRANQTEKRSGQF